MTEILSSTLEQSLQKQTGDCIIFTVKTVFTMSIYFIAKAFHFHVVVQKKFAISYNMQYSVVLVKIKLS
jgi:hypothetical protein